MDTSIEFGDGDDREIKRFGQGFIHEDETIANLKKWGFQNWSNGDDEKLERDRENFISMHNEAVELYHAYAERFQACNGDRARVQAVRADLRLEERLLTGAKRIIWMAKEKMDWMHSIFRAEAVAAERNGAERLAEIARVREEERLAELAELQQNSKFGMF